MTMPRHIFFLFIQYAIPLLYAALVLFLRVLPVDASYLQVVWLVAGFYLGFLLLWIDERFLYHQYNQLQTLPKRLVTRSVLFALVYLVLLVFMVTSTGSMLGVGIVLGIGVQLALEYHRLRHDAEQFHQTFLFQLKRRMLATEISRLLLIFNAVLVVMSVYFLIK